MIFISELGLFLFSDLNIPDFFRTNSNFFCLIQNVLDGCEKLFLNISISFEFSPVLIVVASSIFPEKSVLVESEIFMLVKLNSRFDFLVLVFMAALFPEQYDGNAMDSIQKQTDKILLILAILRFKKFPSFIRKQLVIQTKIKGDVID